MCIQNGYMEFLFARSETHFYGLVYTVSGKSCIISIIENQYQLVAICFWECITKECPGISTVLGSTRYFIQLSFEQCRQYTEQNDSEVSRDVWFPLHNVFYMHVLHDVQIEADTCKTLWLWYWIWLAVVLFIELQLLLAICNVTHT